MSRKYELISELYDRTCKTVVSNVTVKAGSGWTDMGQ